MNYPTPHIDATPSDFAKTVLMPGDPLRSKFIAENYLENAVLINNLRGVQGYTGTYKNQKISVMASGMGMPSIGIYSYELFAFFGVENILRVGSIGSLQPEIDVNDIIIAMSASTNSAYMNQYNLNGSFAPTASASLFSSLVKTADKLKIKHFDGNVLSSDTFYNADETINKKWAELGILGIEMESAALFANAAKLKKKAAAVFTVSDSIVNGKSLSGKDRERSFDKMITLAFESATEF